MSSDPCKGIEHQLQPYLDRALTESEVGMIETHLGDCGYCAERYQFEARLRDRVKTVCCGEPVPAGLVDRVRLRARAQQT